MYLDSDEASQVNRLGLGAKSSFLNRALTPYREGSDEKKKRPTNPYPHCSHPCRGSAAGGKKKVIEKLGSGAAKLPVASVVSAPIVGVLRPNRPQKIRPTDAFRKM